MRYHILQDTLKIFSIYLCPPTSQSELTTNSVVLEMLTSFWSAEIEFSTSRVWLWLARTYKVVFTQNLSLKNFECFISIASWILPTSLGGEWSYCSHLTNGKLGNRRLELHMHQWPYKYGLLTLDARALLVKMIYLCSDFVLLSFSFAFALECLKIM